MFERLTPAAREALDLAQIDAFGHGQAEIGTDHLLLGALHERGSVAWIALEALGLAPEELYWRVHGPDRAHIEEGLAPVPLSDGMKRAIELSLRESIRLGDAHIGTEHLLLGLLRQRRGGAALALRAEGITLRRLRDAVSAARR